MTGQPEAASASSAGAVTWPAIQAYFPHRRAATYLRPLPEHNLIYVKNPKAGCSTILMWLDRLYTGEYDTTFRNIHKEHRLPKLQNVGRRTVARMLSGSAYRFSFVRDPLRRFESVYWDKMVRDVRFREKSAPELGLAPDASGFVTVEQFLEAVEAQDPMTQMDPHWRPQHINLLHPIITYDYIGRLETFAADLEVIREVLGLPRVPYEVRNRSARRSAKSVYEGRPDLVRRVKQLYACDFELYGY